MDGQPTHGLQKWPYALRHSVLCVAHCDQSMLKSHTLVSHPSKLLVSTSTVMKKKCYVQGVEKISKLGRGATRVDFTTMSPPIIVLFPTATGSVHASLVSLKHEIVTHVLILLKEKEFGSNWAAAAMPCKPNLHPDVSHLYHLTGLKKGHIVTFFLCLVLSDFFSHFVSQTYNLRSQDGSDHHHHRG